jgi:hypothetical protein
MVMRKFFEYGGFAAGALLVVFGVAVIALGLSGRSTVNTNLSQEAIVGSDDMSPAAIKESVGDASWVANVDLPSCDVAGKSIDSGSEARCFAQYMRIHALRSSDGLTYAQMGRFVAKANPDDPAGTSDEALALTDSEGNPVANSARNTWVTETALATALNVSYMAERLSLFSIVVGIALLLSGIGFVVLDYVALHVRRRATEPVPAARESQHTGAAAA